jgi:hypothetical protein
MRATFQAVGMTTATEQHLWTMAGLVSRPSSHDAANLAAGGKFNGFEG